MTRRVSGAAAVLASSSLHAFPTTTNTPASPRRTDGRRSHTKDFTGWRKRPVQVFEADSRVRVCVCVCSSVSFALSFDVTPSTRRLFVEQTTSRTAGGGGGLLHRLVHEWAEHPRSFKCGGLASRPGCFRLESFKFPFPWRRRGSTFIFLNGSGQTAIEKPHRRHGDSTHPEFSRLSSERRRRRRPGSTRAAPLSRRIPVPNPVYAPRFPALPPAVQARLTLGPTGAGLRLRRSGSLDPPPRPTFALLRFPVPQSELGRISVSDRDADARF